MQRRHAGVLSPGYGAPIGLDRGVDRGFTGGVGVSNDGRVNATRRPRHRGGPRLQPHCVEHRSLTARRHPSQPRSHRGHRRRQRRISLRPRGIAERLRRGVAESQWELSDVTISIGVATMQDGIEEAAGLINAADAALYAAKGESRNRVISAEAA